MVSSYTFLKQTETLNSSYCELLLGVCQTTLTVPPSQKQTLAQRTADNNCAGFALQNFIPNTYLVLADVITTSGF